MSLRQYIAVIQDPRGYPSDGTLEKAPPDGPAQPMLYTVVKAHEHESEVERLREVLREVTSALDDAIAHNCNATADDAAGWTQEDYDAWDAARAKGEAATA